MRNETAELSPSAGQLSLGQAIRDRRRALGLTQQDLADLADVGVRLVHEVERDATSVQLRNLLKLLDVLGLHLELAVGATARVGTSAVTAVAGVDPVR